MEDNPMGKWFKLAIRNIKRNRRRSMMTLAAIAVGFAALSLFQGYMHSTYTGLRESAIRGEGLGHLTIFQTGWLTQGQQAPADFMFSGETTRKIINLVEAEADVLLATPRLHISGLVSNGVVSTIFLAQGVIPRDDSTIKGAFAAFRPVKGQTLDDRRPYGVEMADGLARILSLTPGAEGVAMAPTLDGQMNAMDILVAGTYNSGSDATNDKLMRVPLGFAQSLYDTDKADRIVVLLDDWQKTEPVRRRLYALLKESHIDVEIKTWEELSLFYHQVKGMFDMIFFFLFCIVLIIVVMSTVNTMSMAVLERTREVGTMRALGLKRRGVSMLFAVEGVLLGLVGCLGGIGLKLLVWGLFEWLKPTYTPPGVSTAVPVVIDLAPVGVAVLCGFFAVFSLLAAILPARRAARQNVVEALGHV
jgi:putative ABC transport system permease protein